MTQANVEEYLRASTQINEFALQEEFLRLPADIAYWNTQYAEAHKANLIAKLDREKAWAAAVKAARVVLSPKGPSGGKGPTVADVEAEALEDPNYTQAKLWEIHTEVEKVKLSGTLDSLRAKQSMLITIGANQRAELQQGLHINERSF